jgi:hypothetical protein
MSDNVVKMPIRTPVGAVVGEWNIKMRMTFGGSAAFEFDLPPMAMSPAAVDDIVAAFRAAVEAANHD